MSPTPCGVLIAKPCVGAKSSGTVRAMASAWQRSTVARPIRKVRLYDSGVLEPGYAYSYKVAATWNQDGEPITDVRTVQVVPGRAAVIDFRRPQSEVLPPPSK